MKKVIGKSADKIVLFPIAFCDDMTSSVAEGSAVDIIYLVSKIFLYPQWDVMV